MSDPTRVLRHHTIRNLVGDESIESQEKLVAKLQSAGFSVTQSSVSRDLQDLGIVKSGGNYKFIRERSFNFPDFSSAATAGPNLLVLKTGIGAAQLVAVRIDKLQLPEIVGTIAGDDTIFIATSNSQSQELLIKKLGLNIDV